MDKTLLFTINIAKKAGKILLDNRKKFKRIKTGDKNDVLTNADLLSNHSIVNAIKKKFPEDHIYTEHGEYNKTNQKKGWIIDPLDGTTNYSRGDDNFSVSIARYEDDEIKIGVVYVPVTNKCYYASNNNGAFLNGKKIHPSTKKMLNNSIILLGADFKEDESVIEMKRLFSILSPKISYRLKIAESAAINMCQVASGVADAYIHPTEKIHDMAAGVLIAKESGCEAVNYSFDNKVKTWKFRNKGLILACNKKLLEKINEKI